MSTKRKAFKQRLRGFSGERSIRYLMLFSIYIINTELSTKRKGCVKMGNRSLFKYSFGGVSMTVHNTFLLYIQLNHLSNILFFVLCVKIAIGSNIHHYYCCGMFIILFTAYITIIVVVSYFSSCV